MTSVTSQRQKNQHLHNQPSKRPDVTVLLPAYNEAKIIGDIVRQIRKIYPDYEVLVIDDGSTDNTTQVALDAGANVWPHPYNIGNGAAIKTGLRCAQGEWVIMLDADGQHKPEDISRLCAHRPDYDMVVGARAKGSQASWHRALANKIYNTLASFVTKFKVQDLTSGFRLVKRDVARSYIYLLPNAFSYPTTLTMAYLRSGRSVKYVPIHTKKRQGKSKIKILEDGARFFLIIIKIATLFSPLRVFWPVSIALFGAGLTNYLYTYSMYGRFTNMSDLLLSSSLIIFMMGLISEQVSQMRYDRVED